MATLVLKVIVLQKLVKNKTTITKYETYFFPESCNSSTTSTLVNYQDNGCKFILLYILTAIYNCFTVWKPVAIVSLAFCFLLMLCLIILIIVLSSCILKMKRNDDRGMKGIQCYLNIK